MTKVWITNQTDDGPAPYPEKKPKFQPMGPWVLIRFLDDLRRTDGGLFLPRELLNDERQSRLATVVSVGRTVTKVKAGDRVAVRWSKHLEMDPYATRVLSLFPKKMRLLPERKILGVFDHA